MNFFDSTLIYPIFDVESIGDGPRVPRAHLEVVLTQLLAASATPLYTVSVICARSLYIDFMVWCTPGWATTS